MLDFYRTCCSDAKYLNRMRWKYWLWFKRRASSNRIKL